MHVSVRHSYWWLNLYERVRTYECTCKTFQWVKLLAHVAAPLTTLLVTLEGWESIITNFALSLLED